MNAMGTLVMMPQGSSGSLSWGQQLVAILGRQVVQIADVILAISQQTAVAAKLWNQFAGHAFFAGRRRSDLPCAWHGCYSPDREELVSLPTSASRTPPANIRGLAVTASGSGFASMISTTFSRLGS